MIVHVLLATIIISGCGLSHSPLLTVWVLFKSNDYSRVVSDQGNTVAILSAILVVFLACSYNGSGYQKGYKGHQLLLHTLKWMDMR